MKFAIQCNLMNETQLQSVAAATKSFPHVYIGVIPFTHEITSDEPISGIDYIPYGSTLLTNIAADLGWRGLHFDVQKLNYEHFVKNRSDMLNNGYIFDVQEAIAFLTNQMRGGGQQWFMRPSEDLKHFSGYVDDSKELAEHLKSMRDSFTRGEIGSYGINPETKIVLAPPEDISAEWRWFIVGGKIISGSMYRAHGQLRKARELEKDVILEAQALADKWLPMDCVVMDTALVHGEVKIVEFNTINSSGFYDHDINSVFDSLWKYHNKAERS